MTKFIVEIPESEHLSPSVEIVNDLWCPHCRNFSFFIGNRAQYHGAVLWRESMVRWVHAPSVCGTVQGIAVLKCPNPKCAEEFGIRLTAEQYEIYRFHTKARLEREHRHLVESLIKEEPRPQILAAA